MRWRGEKFLSATCAARTAISSSSNREKSGTLFSVSALHAIVHLVPPGFHNLVRCGKRNRNLRAPVQYLTLILNTGGPIGHRSQRSRLRVPHAGKESLRHGN